MGLAPKDSSVETGLNFWRGKTANSNAGRKKVLERGSPSIVQRQRWLLSNSAIGFVSEKGRGPFLPLLLWRLSKAHTWPAAVLVDELETAGSTLRE
jgi:hypothetical protein